MTPTNSDSSFRNIARNISIFGGSQAFGILAALIRSKAAALLIGPVGLGLSGLYNTIINFYVALTGFGLGTSGVRNISVAIEQGDTASATAESRYLRITCLWTWCVAGIAVLLTLLFIRFVHPLKELTVQSILVILLIICLRHSYSCEMAILKAYRKISALTTASIIISVCSVVLVVPCYYWWGVAGVLPALAFSATAELLLICFYSHRTVPFDRALFQAFYSPDPRLRIGLRTLWLKMRPVLLMGLSTIVSGVLASGVELLVQTVIAATATMTVVGLYRAGYQLSIIYPCSIFTAIGNDFYPRLSGVNQEALLRNRMVSRQMAVTFAIVLPLTLLFAALMPYLIPLLFSHKFDDMLPMAEWACWYLPFKALSLPLAYMPLALGKWRDYMFVEISLGILMSGILVAGWHLGGLEGLGIALLLFHAVELFFNYAFCRLRYRFRWTIR
jgi:O-antigen/teichoic acid export membrane protein